MARASLQGSGKHQRSGGKYTATMDSVASNHNVNAERAAKHARRINKASSQGAQPPTPNHQVNLEKHK